MQRRVNSSHDDDDSDTHDENPPHKNSMDGHFPLSTRLAATWNPNWQTNESTQDADEIGLEEPETEEEFPNSNNIDDMPDEVDNEMEEPRRPVRSNLKNNSSVSLLIKKKSKVRVHKSKSKRSWQNANDGKRESFARAELINFPISVTDIDTYRRYLSRPPPQTGADDGSSKDETKAQAYFGTRRTMAISQAVMSLALLAISASQLRFVIVYENAQILPNLSFFLLTICIIIEVIGGVGYLILARFQFNEDLMDKIQSYLMFSLFCVAIITIFMSSFALENHVCETFILGQEVKEHGKGPSETNILT